MLVLEDDGDLREVLGDLIGNVCQRRCIQAGSFDDLVALGERALGCGLAILDVNLGPDRPSGVDAYDWLLAHDFRGRVVFLTGHARTHPAVERAFHLRAANVYQKPITLAQLRALVEGAP